MDDTSSPRDLRQQDAPGRYSKIWAAHQALPTGCLAGWEPDAISQIFHPPRTRQIPRSVHPHKLDDEAPVLCGFATARTKVLPAHRPTRYTPHHRLKISTSERQNTHPTTARHTRGEPRSLPKTHHQAKQLRSACRTRRACV